METIEIGDDDWARLKRRLMERGADDALKGYAPPVRLTHGAEYVIYCKEGCEDDPESID